MSLRTRSLGWLATLCFVVGCGASSTKVRSNEPQTAKEKQRREAAAKGEVDTPGGTWGAWRYTGDRNECFYVIGRRCFKTEAAACSAAKCGKRKCEITGGGPAAVSCAKS